MRWEFVERVRHPIQPVGLLSPVTNAATLEASIKSGLTAMSSTEQLSVAADISRRDPWQLYRHLYSGEERRRVRRGPLRRLASLRCAATILQLLLHPRRRGEGGAASTGADPVPTLDSHSQDRSGQWHGTAGWCDRLEDNISVQGMYLANERMFALTGESIYGTYGDLWAGIAIWAPEQLGYRVYDVSNAGNPVLQVDAKIDGIFVESRRIGNTVYIVSRYTPHIDGLNYSVSTAAEQAQNEATLANVTLDELLPTITVNGETQSLVAPDRCYATTTDDGVGYPVITSITAVPIDDPTSFSTTCYNEAAYGVYVSENALYFTELRPAVAVSRDTTRIHKFALSGTEVRYRGSADIGGTVWRGGQADFRMSESGGFLRVLTSQFDRNNEDFVDHMLYVLQESSASFDLDIVSTLPNDNRPEEIGKANEALYGVRFLADRAYAVTFLRIDPLYAIDLSDPADPFIAGELEITGFSDFLHPVNDNLLLGLGTGGNGGVKLELFDVSNIAQPLSRGSATLGGRGSHSEAVYNRHAFTYQQNVNGVDRFTIPATLYSLDGRYQYLTSALFLFEIRDKDMPAVASLNSVGSIAPPADGTSIPYYSDRNRAFIHDDTVYYARDEAVWAAYWYSPGIVNGPF